MSRRIVLALDGSAESERALSIAEELAVAAQAAVTVVHVREMVLAPAGGGRPRNIDEDQIEATVRSQVARLLAAGIDAELEIVVSTYAGGPAHEIVEIASGADAWLIVAGTRGLGRIAGLLVGSVAHRLPYIARCPVLIVPPGEDTDPAA
jgi:nucleotide-binding universal stress UspA family protein